jgi:hypothetical protein
MNYGLFLSLLGACSSPQKNVQDTLVSVSATSLKDSCGVLRNSLPTLKPPFQLPLSQSLDPFAVEVQEWLRKKLADTGIYAPVGRWQGSPTRELWLIERITSEGSWYYAVLSDSLCEITDTAVWAYQLVAVDKLERAQASLSPSGECTILYEKHITDITGEQPRTEVSRQTRSYAVDWTAGKLRSL